MGGRGNGIQAGWLSITGFRDGSCFTIAAFSAAFRRSSFSDEGCAGAGGSARVNIISTGTGPFAVSGVTKVIWMFTLIAGSAHCRRGPQAGAP